MRRAARLRALVLALALSIPLAVPLVMTATSVLAVLPDEVLEDPALEARARELSRGLRCLVCRNESIDESNAELARDLRLLVRERLVAGDSNDEVLDFVVDRYGEYVLLKPLAGGANWMLWAAGPAMLLLAAGVAFAYLRGRRDAPVTQETALTQDEKDRLRKIMEE